MIQLHRLQLEARNLFNQTAALGNSQKGTCWVILHNKEKRTVCCELVSSQAHDHRDVHSYKVETVITDVHIKIPVMKYF